MLVQNVRESPSTPHDVSCNSANRHSPPLHTQAGASPGVRRASPPFRPVQTPGSVAGQTLPGWARALPPQQPPHPPAPAGLLAVFLYAVLDFGQPVLMAPVERLRYACFDEMAGQIAHSVVGPALEEPAHDSKFMTGATSSGGRKKLSASRNAGIVETPREISLREYPISDNGVVSSNAMLNMSDSTRIQLATP